MNFQTFSGVSWVILASFFGASMGAIVKQASALAGPLEILFFQNLVGLGLVFLWIRFGDNQSSFRTTRIKVHALRAMVGMGACFCFYLALGKISVTTTVLLVSTYPIFIPILMKCFGQALPKGIGISILLGILGLILIVNPDLTSIDANNAFAWVALLAGFLTGISVLVIRNLSQTESASLSFFYYCLISVFVLLPFVWNKLWNIQMGSLFWFALMIAIFFLFQQIGIHRATQRLNSALVGLLLYSAVFFSLIFDWIFWGVLPSARSWVGMAFLLGGCLLAILSQSKIKIKKTKGGVKHENTDYESNSLSKN